MLFLVKEGAKYQDKCDAPSTPGGAESEEMAAKEQAAKQTTMAAKELATQQRHEDLTAALADLSRPSTPESAEGEEPNGLPVNTDMITDEAVALVADCTGGIS